MARRRPRLEAAGVAARRRDGGDRRRVFVVPNLDFVPRIAALLVRLARVTDALLSQYSAEDMALVQGFVAQAQAQALMQGETRRLNAPARGRLNVFGKI
jgi:DNA-binding MarR family transcriptional regulator